MMLIIVIIIIIIIIIKATTTKDFVKSAHNTHTQKHSHTQISFYTSKRLNTRPSLKSLSYFSLGNVVILATNCEHIKSRDCNLTNTKFVTVQSRWGKYFL